MLPERIPYKFNMTAVVRGSHKIQAVTSTGDCLKVETNSDHSTTVNIVKCKKGKDSCTEEWFSKSGIGIVFRNFEYRKNSVSFHRPIWVLFAYLSHLVNQHYR